MNNNFTWPLMNDSISSQDKESLINFINEPNIRFTNGKKVEEFEIEWSKWLGTSFSLFVNSGSSANDITMMVLAEKYGTGDVIVPPLTWVSDISSVLRAGHRPVFVDIDPRTLALDPVKLKDAINPNTKAVFLTHVLGINGLNDDLLELLSERNILLFEDVCESHGATFKGRKVGTFGLASNFSFYFAHHMTTIEGGMISSNDEDFYNIARLMRSHGLVRESRIESFKRKFIEEHSDLNPEFIFAYASHNMRSTEINAVLGLSQLKRLDKNIQKRVRNFKLFLDNLDPRIFEVNFSIEGNSNYALIMVLREKSIDIRDKVEFILQENRIEYRRGTAGGGNQLRQPYLKKYNIGQRAIDFPIVEHIHFYSWYVGNNEHVTEYQIKNLCESLRLENLL